jgi:fumarate hydratase class II
MPQAIIRALIQIKEAAAQANNKLGVFPHKQITLIEKTADEILDGQYDGEFPLKV